MLSPSRRKPYIPVMSSPRADLDWAISPSPASIKSSTQRLRMAQSVFAPATPANIFSRKNLVIGGRLRCLLRYNQGTCSLITRAAIHAELCASIAVSRPFGAFACQPAALHSFVIAAADSLGTVDAGGPAQSGRCLSPPTAALAPDFAPGAV